MLRRFFIPLMLALLVIAGGLYWMYGRTTQLRDVRAAVPVEQFKLSNGLSVVVMPNDRIPAVTHLLVVKAGSADDPYGKSGMAHYLEHLMFSGTKNFPEGVYDRSIARVGGTQNAYTTRDYTLYFSTVAKEHVPMVIAMEADRLQNMEINDISAARELKIIREERSMRVDNSAAAQLLEQLDALTFLNHPYRQPVIGWAEDMETFTAADAQQFFAERYRASNMVLVMAGDITVRDARRYAQKYYGGLTSGGTPTRSWPKEPKLKLARHAQMQDAKAKEPRLIRQYVAPSVHGGDRSKAMALELLSHYLGGGETSLLYQKLVREQKLATAIEVDYSSLSLGPSLFRMMATPAAAVSLPQLEQALARELASMVANAPDGAALERSKTLFKAEVVFAQDGITPLAHVMSRLYAVGLDEQYFYDWAAMVDRVTATELQAAAAAVLTPSNKVTGYLLPANAAMEVPHAP